MADLILPDPRFEMLDLFIPGKKPFGPVKINWNHPFTKELKVCILFNGAGSELNYVTGKKHQIAGAYERGVDSNGKYLDMNSNTSNYLMIDDLSITLPFSMFLLVMPNTVTNFYSALSLGNSTSIHYHYLRYDNSTFRVGAFDGDSSPYAVLGTIAINNFYSAGVILDTSYRYGINNGVRGSTNVETTTFTDILTRAAFAVSADSSPYNGLDAKYYMGCVWNERKSEEFLRSMYRNPYQFLEPA